MVGKVIFLVLLTCISTSALAQEKRSARIGEDEIILQRSGLLQFQKERKYRGYLIKLTNEDSILAVGYKGGVQVWDTSTGKHRLCLGEEGKTYNYIALSSNGEYLAGYRDKKIFVWATGTCNAITSVAVDKDLNSSGLAISSDGRYLFYSHDSSGPFRKREKVILWDIERGVEVADLQPERLPIYKNGYDPLFDREALRPSSGDFSPDSKTIAVQYSYRIYLWDSETGRRIHRFTDSSLENEASQIGIYDVLFSDDGSLMISRGGDGRVKLWDIDTKRLTNSFDISERVHGKATLRADGMYMAVGDNKGQISLWAVSSGRMLWKGARKNYFPSFSTPDVGLVSVESGEIFDLLTGEIVQGIKGEFLTDGQLLVKENDGNMSTWKVERR